MRDPADCSAVSNGRYKDRQLERDDLIAQMNVCNDSAGWMRARTGLAMQAGVDVLNRGEHDPRGEGYAIGCP